MSIQEILDYFSDHTVYLWNGSIEELHESQLAAGASYNTLITSYKIYFTSQGVVNDSRATIVTL